MVACDREAAESDGQFGTLVAGLRPDAVVDLTCFTPAQARQLVEALDGQHVVQTGSVWSYGPSAIVPTTEDAPKHPYGQYGINKLAIEQYLMAQDRVRASVVHPGHISGPGWMPIGPAGNLDPAVIDSLRADGSCLLPDRGGETIHHVHAEDVARPCTRRASTSPMLPRARASTACARRRSRCAATPRSWPATSVTSPGLEFVPWARVRCPRRRRAAPTRPWTTSGGLPMYSMDKARAVLGFVPSTASPTPCWSPSTPGWRRSSLRRRTTVRARCDA